MRGKKTNDQSAFQSLKNPQFDEKKNKLSSRVHLTSQTSQPHFAPSHCPSQLNLLVTLRYIVQQIIGSSPRLSILHLIFF
jgi:hypothetical protein